eukprot:5081631-Prymnesium_polylepis.1
MPSKSTGSTGPDRRIQDILNGNVEAYVRWAEIQIHGLERDREFLKKQARAAEQRCAAAERMHRMAMDSEAGQRERAEKAEKRLAHAEARLRRLRHLCARQHARRHRPLCLLPQGVQPAGRLHPHLQVRPLGTKGAPT